jgi:hypothetical protein
MRLSKWVQVNKDILIEYIYDQDNLISERYAVIFNEKTMAPSFASTLSKTKNYADLVISETSKVIPNTPVNQLVKLSEIDKTYAKFDISTQTFIQKKDYPPSIPISYDRIRIHMPVNYVFGNFNGCHLRVYTLDYNDEVFIDLSNYFFNIRDVNQFNDLQYSIPSFIHNGVNWGKYLEIQIPSVNKVSDLRRNGSARENTINYNLTAGKGLSKKAPVFMDFHFIEDTRTVNDIDYFRLTSKVSTSFPQTPEFELLGVNLDKSDQGEFFTIYPTYNSTLGEFVQFMNESIYEGNRYYIKYLIEVFEKNIKTYEITIVVTDDFIEEIEFRPILKYTSTTAVIDVTMDLIDRVDESKITRKATYGMLQDQVSNYSRYLTRLDVSKIYTKDVLDISNILQPNLGRSDINVNTELDVKQTPFVVYSKSYNIIPGDTIVTWKNINYTPNRRLTINIMPFDNIMKFVCIEKDTVKRFVPFNFAQYTNVQLTFRSDTKTIDIPLYRDSDQNELDRGVAIFKVKEDKYPEIWRMYQNGSNAFYITGRKDNLKQIIYNGKFTPWESDENKQLLESTFTINQRSINDTVDDGDQNTSELIQIEASRKLKSENLSTEKSTNTSQQKNSSYYNSDEKKNISIDDKRKSLTEKLLGQWIPYWNSPLNILARSHQYKFENKDYKFPGDVRRFAIKLRDVGILQSLNVDTNGTFSTKTQKDIDLVLGYMKIHNFDPNDNDIIDFIGNNVLDIEKWIKSGSTSQGVKKSFPQGNLTKGINQPPNKDVYDAINNILSFERSLPVDKQLDIETGYQLRTRL